MRQNVIVLINVIGLFLVSGTALATEVLPQGSYQQTCTNCSYDEGELSCECSDNLGNPPGFNGTTTLNVGDGCGDIGNNNGQLVCSGSGSNNVLPAGSYQNSCTNCSFSGGELTCECSDDLGNPPGFNGTTTLWVGEENNCSDIGNDNAQLVCSN